MKVSKELRRAIFRWSELHRAAQNVSACELLLRFALRDLSDEDRATFDEATGVDNA